MADLYLLSSVSSSVDGPSKLSNSINSLNNSNTTNNNLIVNPNSSYARSNAIDISLKPFQYQHLNFYNFPINHQQHQPLIFGQNFSAPCLPQSSSNLPFTPPNIVSFDHPNKQPSFHFQQQPQQQTQKAGNVNYEEEIQRIKEEVAMLKEQFNQQMWQALQSAYAVTNHTIPFSQLVNFLDIPLMNSISLPTSFSPKSAIISSSSSDSVNKINSITPGPNEKLKENKETATNPSLTQNDIQNESNKRTLRQAVKHRVASSKFRGVYFNKLTNNWRARIWLGGSSENIGSFETEEEAARAFDKRAIELRGPRAIVNFPDSHNDPDILSKGSHIQQHKEYSTDGESDDSQMSKKRKLSKTSSISSSKEILLESAPNSIDNNGEIKVETSITDL